jgi:hypothetical protein
METPPGGAGLALGLGEATQVVVEVRLPCRSLVWGMKNRSAIVIRSL